jgi:hypothetical protein
VDGANFLIGQSTTGSTVGRRYHLNDGLTWQKGAHRLRHGFEWEHTTLSQFSVTNDPASRGRPGVPTCPANLDPGGVPNH